MRCFTYPATNITLVSTKDGSTIRKNWVYFRSAILLEAPSTSWRTIISSSRSKLSDKSSKKDPTPPLKKAF